jgi:hypothetical protein
MPVIAERLDRTLLAVKYALKMFQPQRVETPAQDRSPEIRRLHAAGYKRSAIAGLLRVRYADVDRCLDDQVSRLEA